MIKERSAYWDNAKAILIFLVVLGHMLAPVEEKGKVARMVYDWIYLFHMPAFVFVSGVFSKSFVKGEQKEARLAGFLILYIGFAAVVKLMNMAYYGEFHPDEFVESFFVHTGAPWYMLAMLFWHGAIVFFSRVRPEISLPFTLIVALLAGNIRECGDFLVLSRTIVFFPFFLAGFHWKRSICLSRNRWLRLGGACVLVTSAVVLYLYRAELTGVLKLVFANSSYEKLELTGGMFLRLMWYLWASLLAAAFLCVIPGRTLPITYIGERTMGIYVVHRLIRDLFQYLHVYRFMGTDVLLVVECVLIAAVVVFLTSARPITVYLNKAFQCRFLIREK